uniref:DUF1848 domain-containing protein n=1 Tax=Chlorobium chlorochromatii (strain CaD3) TaxID=340177 RepID=Q3AR19_CHLCH
MIISASRRTDIPAFYGEWFINRLRVGEVLVRNPMQPKQVSHIALTPETIDALVFWTKNPNPFFRYLAEIDAFGYPYYFLFTITPYDTTIEPHVPTLEKRIAHFQYLAKRIGAERVVWRYDPILFTKTLSPTWHIAAFRHIANALSGYTKRCIISFIDNYRKVRRNMASLPLITPNEGMITQLLQTFTNIAEQQQINLQVCREEIDVTHYGIANGSCIDRSLVEQLCGRPLVGIGKDKNQRKTCGCIASRDIGRYDTCLHGCRYCYAVSNHAKAAAAYKNFNPDTPLLCNELCGNETITCAPKQNQSKLECLPLFEKT